MKTIVLVIRDLKGNGAERVVINLATELTTRGHKCAIICFVDKQELPVPDGIPVYIFPAEKYRWIPRGMRGKLLAPFFDKFVRKSLGCEPDLVLSNLVPADRILAHSSLQGVHFIIHSTTSLEVKVYFKGNWKKELATRMKMYRGRPCIGVSKGVRDDLRALIPEHSSIKSIYNPMDIQSVIEQSAAKIDEVDDDYIIHVGKFNEVKQHDVLIKAYAKSGVTTPLCLLGIGPRMEAMKNLVQSLGIEQRVHFLGFKSNPYPYIKNAKFMVLTSKFEGLGMVLLEAIVLKCPVVSVDCPSGPAEILPESNLVKLDDESSLIKIIIEADKYPGQYVTELKEDFQPEVICESYLSLC